VAPGGRLGIVGESGSGKSTLARAILGLVRARRGTVSWQGRVIDYRDRAALRALRRDVQIVFQDPFGSLDPRMTAGEAIDEALQAATDAVPPAEARARVGASLRDVGLDAELADRYPHELSGGQCQRVAIARATVNPPKLLICDEAVSALDVSVQAQVVNLLDDLCVRHAMALMFISHNLVVVRQLCDDIAVLRAGRLVERGDRTQIFTRPQDAYTRALLDAVPEPDPAVQRAKLAAETVVPA
jgi:ABC-type glutathione transport system ATPase component